MKADRIDLEVILYELIGKDAIKDYGNRIRVNNAVNRIEELYENLKQKSKKEGIKDVVGDVLNEISINDRNETFISDVDFEEVEEKIADKLIKYFEIREK
jgi:uncharacterized protein YpuA (DUF1002 family)